MVFSFEILIESDDTADGPDGTGARVVSQGLEHLEVVLRQVFVEWKLESWRSVVGGGSGIGGHLGGKLLFELEHHCPHVTTVEPSNDRLGFGVVFAWQNVSSLQELLARWDVLEESFGHSTF